MSLTLRRDGKVLRTAQVEGRVDALDRLTDELAAAIQREAAKE